MQDWFEWNGRRCTEFGIHVSEQPPITVPRERVEQVTIPGRPGTLTIAEGDDVYEDMALEVACFISDSSRIPEIAACTLVALLQIVKKNMYLSIIAGTVCYMVLVRVL